MANLRLVWPKSSNTLYEIYRSNRPGHEYESIGVVPSTQADIEEYIVERDIEIRNLNGEGLRNTVSLSWDAEGGSPETYKVIPYDDKAIPEPLYTPTRDEVWMHDTLPPGAIWVKNEGAQWSSHNLYGSASLMVEAEDGYVYPQFKNAIRAISERYIVIWVYIEPEYVPDSIMITLYDGDWIHRAYWGKDLFPYGTEGTPTMYHMGSIPTPECWTPLVIDKEILQAKSITGMGFGIFKEVIEGSPGQVGRAYFGSVCVSDQRVLSLQEQHVPVDKFIIYKKSYSDQGFQKIGETKEKQFIDNDSPDTEGLNQKNYRPNYSIQPHDSGEQIKFTWTVPQGIGTKYDYIVQARDSYGQVYEGKQRSVYVSNNHGYIVIRGGTSKDYNSLPILSTEYGSEFVHTGLSPGSTYYYRLESYDLQDNKTSVFDTSVRTRPGSVLDFFILGQSSLA